MDLEKLKVFHIVATKGSVYKASEKLNLAQSAISRSIRLLEESLETKLFVRVQSKGMTLTHTGQILYEKANEILKAAKEAEESILDHNKDPSGVLEIVGTHGFINNWFMQHVPEFLEKNPKIRFSLIGSTHLTLANSTADVCIASFGSEGPEFNKDYLWTIRYKIYASKEYLKKFGHPKTPKELKDHRIIVYSKNSGFGIRHDNWLLNFGVEPEGEPHDPYMYINSTDGMFYAIKAGLGIGAVVEDYVQPSKVDVVELFPDEGYKDIHIYYWYRSHMKHSKRITTLLEYLKQKIGEQGVRNIESPSISFDH
ncbi:MAG: LysR family transcriptional regulator [Candidatus Nucleicultricaceae bacterium]